MKPNKRIAAGIAGALAVGGVAVLTMGGSPAQAAVPASLNCNTGSNAGGFLSAYSPGATLTLSPATPNAGDTVTGTFAATNGLTNASPVTLVQGSAQPLVFLNIAPTGAAAGVALLKTPGDSYPAADIDSGDPVGPYTATGTFTASGNGTTTATIRQLVVNGGLPTYCGTGTGNVPGVSGSTVGTAVDPATAGYPVNYNTNYPAAVGWNTDGQGYQSFRASGGPVTISIGSANVPYGSATNSVTGPNYAISAVSGQSVTTHARAGATVTVSGGVFGADAAPGVPTVSIPGATITNNTLEVNSGVLSGSFDVATATSSATPVDVTITNGAAEAIDTLIFLAPAAATPPIASAGVGGSVAITLTDNTWNPNQAVSLAAGSATGSITANATGGGSGSISITDGTATLIVLTQGSNTFNIPLTVALDKCVAQDGQFAEVSPGVYENANGDTFCEVEQTLEISITPGILAQRHYQNASPTIGSSNGITPNYNTGNQNVNFGTVVTPVAPIQVYGYFNDITVTDTRGGQTGWSLTATLTDLTAGPGKKIGAERVDGVTTCSTATPATAWDYYGPNGTSKVAVAGYIDPWASTINGTVNLPGFTNNASKGLSTGTPFSPFTANDGTPAKNLCTKNANLNNFGTTGGIFNIGGALRVNVPAFQATGTYTGIMTVTLA
jgi:hypothetical protein